VVAIGLNTLDSPLSPRTLSDMKKNKSTVDDFIGKEIS